MRHLGKQDITTEFDTALESLTCGIYAFSSVAKRMENRLKELEGQEEELKELTRKVEERNQELEEREARMKEIEMQIREREMRIEMMETQIGNRMRELGEVEARWSKTEKIMETNASKRSNKINLHVGGQKFKTSKSTLIQAKGSYFEALVHASSDSNNFYIDRDPKHFGTVLSFLKEGKMPKGVKLEESDEIEKEFQYYELPSPRLWKNMTVTVKDYPSSGRRSPDLFETDTVLSSSHQQTIRNWFPAQNIAMIYKASRDGYKASDFHKKCDNQGPTLTIIQSKEGFIFGGYSPESWESPSNNFSKFKSHPYGILCCSSHCATFGGGPDIYVSSDSHQNSHSYTKFPTSFVDHIGKGRETFTGALHFTTTDVEVYSVI